ncbi:glycosyltransferase family 2 protein [Cyclobacterium qasimii]|uniref:Glycosyl transferase, family 2 n=2 Tax=Cyclobacterium qasimii TaxID=1350429 RepID=S7WTN8_9BACT|nr:glycosyltransferase family 2 protein [Cyclobacterium qasimii]EPR67468.1 glycosyl transferase, family 2 [Cyclobacterium qasimii M12-11B]GEO21784.1 glycosyl transferase family A [Cyclobacterium qasimii]
MKSKLAIVTPAKNEAKNIPNLMKGMAGQTRKPDLWVFINDGSTDDTVSVFKEEQQKFEADFVDTEILLVDYEDEDKSYALGPKYSRIIKFGLNKIYDHEKEERFDYVGILDADVVPEVAYYKTILDKFEGNPKLGIASAAKQQEDYGTEIITSYVNKSFAPSGFRVWRRACLDQTDYTISVSQDSVSAAKAIMMGWKVQSFPELEVSLRQRGAKFGYEYYGKSAYMRHVPFFYVLAGAARMYLSGKKADARQYINGYNDSAKQKINRIEDPLAIKYFKNRFYYKIMGK